MRNLDDILQDLKARCHSVPSVKLYSTDLYAKDCKLTLSIHFLAFESKKSTYQLMVQNIDYCKVLDSHNDRRYISATVSGHTLVIYSKDFYVYEILFMDINDARNVQSSLEYLSKNQIIESLYPFFNNQNYLFENHIFDDHESEFINSFTSRKPWRVSKINKKFEVCSSYPKEILVPRNITDETIANSAKFRRSGRFPIPIFYYEAKDSILLIMSETLFQNTTIPITTPGILPNLNRNRSDADEDLLEAILDGGRGLIIDIRSNNLAMKKSNSLAGFEANIGYSSWSKVDKPLDSLSTIATIFRDLIECCISTIRQKSIMKNDSSRSLIGEQGPINPNTNAPGNKLKSQILLNEMSSASTSSKIIKMAAQSVADNLEGMTDVKIPLSTPVLHSITPGVITHSEYETLGLRRFAPWLTIVRSFLGAAVTIANILESRDAHKSSNPIKSQGNSQKVCILDSDSRDQSIVVASLVEIMLNPKARTIEGFLWLVKRNWLQYGHPFSDRCSTGPIHQIKLLSNQTISTNVRESPIFILFLDCTYQLMSQYQSAFEFNDYLTLLLAKHSYASEFGTFLGNCENDRFEKEVYEKTASIWSYLLTNEMKTQIRNNMYAPVKQGDTTICWPILCPQSLLIWSELYLAQLHREPWLRFHLPRLLSDKQHQRFQKAYEENLYLRETLRNLAEEATKQGLLVNDDIRDLVETKELDFVHLSNSGTESSSEFLIVDR